MQCAVCRVVERWELKSITPLPPSLPTTTTTKQCSKTNLLFLQLWQCAVCSVQCRSQWMGEEYRADIVSFVQCFCTLYPLYLIQIVLPIFFLLFFLRYFWYFVGGKYIFLMGGIFFGTLPLVKCEVCIVNDLLFSVQCSVCSIKCGIIAFW